jgi:thioesterase domain-containing protein
LQTPDLNEEDEISVSLEHIVSHYNAAIQSVQAEGPYLLGGWSLGGVVAFEMAQQLHRQGQQVGLLVLFDSTVPLAYSGLSSSAESEAFERIKVDDRLLARWMIDDGYIMPGKDFDQLAPKEQLRYVWEQAKIAHLLPLDTDFEHFRRVALINARNMQAVKYYVPQIYPHPITLFRAQQSVQIPEDASLSPLARVQISPTGGWEQLTTAGVEVHIVSGTHSEMFDEPYVAELAITLKRCLDDIDH